MSVLLVVYRPHPDFFRAAVRSVLEQTFRDLELVIVEDPSDRPASAVLAEFPDARIRHVVNPARLSLVPSRNEALRHARGQFVAVLDGDDVCLPERIGAQVDFLERHPEVGLVGGQLEIIDGSGATRGFRRHPADHEAIVRAMARYNPLAHSTVMMRRQLVIELGEYFYNESTAEDYDLWCRLARRGIRFANIEDAMVRYRLHPDALKAHRLHETIRATLDVKKKYWRDEVTQGDRLRMWAESALLLLPRSVVYRLFVLTQCRDSRSLPS